MAAVEEIEIISPTLKTLLERDRDTYNALFNMAQHTYPKSRVQPDIFFYYLQLILDPAVKNLEMMLSVEDSSPSTASQLEQTNAPAPDSKAAQSTPSIPGLEEKLRPLVRHLYERILELLGLGLLGDRARYPYFEESFTRLLTGLPRLLLQQPLHLTGAAANAIVKLVTFTGKRVQEWAESLCRVGCLVETVDELLEAGKVSAWRCGMAQYRDDALAICRKLKPALVRRLLDIPADLPIGAVLDKLDADPWHLPAATTAAGSEKQMLQRRTGGFTGFGGPFISPPKVIEKPGGKYFLVRDTQKFFLFIADIFGSVLLPISEEEYYEQVLTDGSGKKEDNSSAAFKISKDGDIEYRGSLYAFPRYARCATFAANRQTYCVTLPFSHYLYFGGLVVRTAPAAVDTPDTPGTHSTPSTPSTPGKPGTQDTPGIPGPLISQSAPPSAGS